MKKSINVLLWLTTFFAFITVSFIIYTSYKNISLKINFTEAENAYRYAYAVEQGNVDLNEVSKLFPNAIGLTNVDYQNTIISPVNISYYRNIDDAAPVYVIEKGNVIHFESDFMQRSTWECRGNESIPTNKKGWRLAKPFKIESKEVNDLLLYVKLNDLIQVTQEWLKENYPLQYHAPEKMVEMGVIPTKYTTSKLILVFTDRMLYTNDVFMSKDILRPIFSPITVIGLLITIILLSLLLLTKILSNNKYHSKG